MEVFKRNSSSVKFLLPTSLEVGCMGLAAGRGALAGHLLDCDSLLSWNTRNTHYFNTRLRAGFNVELLERAQETQEAMTSIFSKWRNCLCQGVNRISYNENTSSRQTAITATTILPTTVFIFKLELSLRITTLMKNFTILMIISMITAIFLKTRVFWDVAPYRCSYSSRRFEGWQCFRNVRNYHIYASPCRIL
jgi:hypothetical protein